MVKKLLQIQSRYRFFTNEEVIIEENANTFEVRIPLMVVE